MDESAGRGSVACHLGCDYYEMNSGMENQEMFAIEKEQGQRER